MRQMTVTRSCDRCDQLGNATEATVTVPLTFGRADAKVIELCEPCDKELIGPVRQLVADYGVKPDALIPIPGEASRARAVPTVRAPRERDPNAYLYSCPMCDYGSPNRRHTLQHLVQVHGVDRIEASQAVAPRNGGETCPACGLVCESLSGLSTHASVAHDGQKLADLAPPELPPLTLIEADEAIAAVKVKRGRPRKVAAVTS